MKLKFLLFILCFGPVTLQSQMNTCPDGQAFMQAYKFNEAVSAFYACHVENQDDINILSNLGYCYQKVGNHNDAKRVYQTILKIDSTHLLSLLSIAQLSETNKNYDEAIRYYDKLISIDSTNAYVFKQKGLALLKKGKRLNAIFNFLKSHELQESDQEVIYQLSRLYLGFDQLESAEIMLKKGLDINPDNIRLLQLKAQFYQRSDAYLEVISAVENLMALGDSSDYYMMLQGAAFMQLDSFIGAIFPLQYVLDLGKENEFVHHYLGLAYQELDSLELSEKHFQLAIETGFSTKQDIFFRDYSNYLKRQGRTRDGLDQMNWAFEISKEPTDLFEIARMTDEYYADKNMAIRVYQKYLDTGDLKYREYSLQRIQTLKEILHFKIK